MPAKRPNLQWAWLHEAVPRMRRAEPPLPPPGAFTSMVLIPRTGPVPRVRWLCPQSPLLIFGGGAGRTPCRPPSGPGSYAAGGGSRREIRGVRVCLRLSSVWAAAAACPP